MSSLNRIAVDVALRQVISNLDYDLHKSLGCDEESGDDTYRNHVDMFVAEYNKVVNGG